MRGGYRCRLHPVAGQPTRTCGGRGFPEKFSGDCAGHRSAHGRNVYPLSGARYAWNHLDSELRATIYHICLKSKPAQGDAMKSACRLRGAVWVLKAVCPGAGSIPFTAEIHGRGGSVIIVSLSSEGVKRRINTSTRWEGGGRCAPTATAC